MAHSKYFEQSVKAVMVSVTYHRNCLIYANEGDDIEQKAREQLRMPNDPALDPSEWSEDEFAVIEFPKESLKLLTRSTPYVINTKNKKK